MPSRFACRPGRAMPRRLPRFAPASMCCSKSRPARRCPNSTTSMALAEGAAASRCSPPGIRALPPASPPPGTGWPAARSARSASTGRRMCANGIRARPGSGSRAASACSIRASTRCRSSPKSCRCRSYLTSATLLFPQNRAQPIAADLVFADGAGERAGDRDLRLAADRPADLGHPRHPRTTASLLLQSGGAKLSHPRRRRLWSGRDEEYAAHLQPIRRS